MQKQEIEIAGYKITQLSETQYEAENSKQNLDFYFEINEVNEVAVFVFDSEVSNAAEFDPFLFAFSEKTLDEAVQNAMLYSNSTVFS